jgi:catechol 2,3-dioxygenase-like lactoylglutathione lyase family enzyme
MKIEPRISIITLGVSDIEKARRFYESGLGWTPSSASQGDIVFFPLGGIVLALYPRALLAEDATVGSSGSGFRGVTLAYNVRARNDVAAVLKIAESAGGAIVKPAQDVFWGGHSGYFADLDGHLWEVAWNPHFKLNERGEILLP